MEQMELYRYTRESIQAGRGAEVFRDMSLRARERALQQEMKAENNLHPALCTPDGHYKARPRPLVPGLWGFGSLGFAVLGLSV